MTLVFGILGDPVAQVRSPEVFNSLFRERGIDAVMVPMRVPAADLGRALSGLSGIANIGGLVITVPHKQSAAALLRTASERVRLAGAANALRPAPGGWEGDLFDGEGFALGLESQGHGIAGKHFAIVGAGGAGAAISLALDEGEMASLSLWDRDIAKAEQLRKRLSAVARAPVLVAPPGPPTDVAVNATPLGMGADDALPFDVRKLPKGAVVADAVMKPPVTRLLDAATTHGCPTQTGRHMLDSQIDLVWRFFGLPQTCRIASLPRASASLIRMKAMTAPIRLDQMRFAKALIDLPGYYPAFIGGRQTEAADGRTIERTSPAFGAVVSRYARGGLVDLDLAIIAARRAFDEQPWPKATTAERSRVLHRAADLIEARAEMLATFDVLESCEPIAQARSEMAGAVDICLSIGLGLQIGPVGRVERTLPR